MYLPLSCTSVVDFLGCDVLHYEGLMRLDLGLQSCGHVIQYLPLSCTSVVIFLDAMYSTMRDWCALIWAFSRVATLYSTYHWAAPLWWFSWMLCTPLWGTDAPWFGPSVVWPRYTVPTIELHLCGDFLGCDVLHYEGLMRLDLGLQSRGHVIK